MRDGIQAARAQSRMGAGAVLDILLRTPGVDRHAVLAGLRGRAGVEVIEASHALSPDFSQWDQINARQHCCVVLRGDGDRVLAAAADPWDEPLMQRIARCIGQQPVPAAVSNDMLQTWVGESTSSGMGSEQGREALAADGPVVQFVDRALMSGFESGASDVHFECDRTGVTVKHRLDGVMERFSRLDGAAIAQEVISRIKVLAQLDITERRLPQDGRFRFRQGRADIDMRVSIMPSVHGEDAVVRLLDKAQLRTQETGVTLDLLGFDGSGAEAIRELANAPSGMLLVTGPTGSGKTTTVYASLSEINTGREKIITIEDPVEYELPGVLQIPVNERKGLTFAKGLRSILRHDPDRILVGEIRDAETAEIAVQSALTGHLVFTTVHANSIADVIGRFRHFGLDMFGFMSALNGVVVQRLVRRVCDQCTGMRPLSEREKDWLVRRQLPHADDVPRPVGCGACHRTGYRGRFVIAEVHLVDDVLRDRITEGAPVSFLKAHALEKGVSPLLSQALRHAFDARTSLEEVKRVVGWV